MNDFIKRLLLQDHSSQHFIVSDRLKTYSNEFIKKRISSFHSLLLKNGVKKNEIVGLLSENSIDFVCSVIAIWNCGAVPAPVNIRSTVEEINSLLNIAGARLLLCSSRYDRLTGLQPELVSISSIKNNESITYKAFLPSEDNDALVIFTSGSTGGPKAVVHTFGTLISSAINGNEFINHKGNDVWLAGLPFYHIGGFSIIIRSLIFNCGLIIADDFSASSLTELAVKYKATLLSIVSVQMKRLLDENVPPPPSLRKILLGGGSINKDLASEAIQTGWNVSLVYGSSETASFVTAIDTKEIPEKPGSSGKPVGNTRIIICDENMNELSSGETGRICIKTSSLFRGYLNTEAVYNAAFHDGWYITGDYGTFDKDGYLYVESRRRDIIVTGGENVSPEEVEQAILSYPGVTGTVVTGISDKEFGEIVAAAVEVQHTTTEAEIKTFLKTKLAGFKIPRKFILSGHLPRNEMGKIIFSDVLKLFRD